MNHDDRTGMGRRSLLRCLRGAAGVAIGLPALASRARRAGAQAATPAAPRFVCYFTPNGHPPAQFWPSGTMGARDTGFVLPAILKPLANFRSRILPIAGLDMRVSRTTGHAGIGSVLTGTRPGQGASLDQALARTQAGTAASLALSVLPTAPAHALASSDLCYAGAGRPVTPEPDPGAAFRKLFAPGMDPARLARDLRRRRSVLDLARQDTQRLQAALGTDDRPVLQQHLEAIRALENNLTDIASVRTRCSMAYAPPVVAANDPAQLTRLRDAQLDLLVLALSCTETRVGTVMLGGPDAPLQFDGLPLGIPAGPQWTWSAISDRNDEAARAAHVRISKWCAEGLGRLLAGLAGRGLLEHTVVLWCTDCNPDHSHENLPFLLAGGESLGLRPGRYLRLQKARPHNDLLASILRAMGQRERSFGEAGLGTGAIEELFG